MDMERGEGNEELNMRLPLVAGTSSHGGFSLPVFISTFVVIMGSLNFGFGVGFSSPSETQIIEDLGLSIAEYSVFGSLLTVGAMAGSSMSGYIADALGRKGALRVCSAFHLAGWLTTAFAENVLPLDIARLLVGYAAGLASYTVPVYIAEVSPKNLRGALTTTNQLFITTGILIVYLMGMFFPWRTVALIGSIPSVLLAMGLFFIPESPRWLAKVGHDMDFKEALQKLRGKKCDVSCEATEIMEYIKELESLPKATIFDLFQRSYRPAVIVGIGLMVLQQLSGINGIIFYSSAILQDAGYSSDYSASVWIATLQVIMTAIGTLLIDKSGRRPLLMIAGGGMSIGCFVVGLSFYIEEHSNQSTLLTSGTGSTLALIGLLAYIGTFSIGMGGVPWIIMSEIFPINMKGVAGSLISLTAWSLAWVVTLTFNFLLSWSATATFFIFCGVCAFSVVFVAKLVPETKGRTLEEIQSSFK